MKKNILIIKFIFLFLVSFVTVFFTWKFLSYKITENNIKNDVKKLYSIAERFNSGSYILKNNKIYSGNDLIISDVNISGYSKIYKNEYGINLKLKQKEFCFYKTLGNDDILKFDGKCEDLDIEAKDVKYNQNNAQITLSSKFKYYSVNKENSIPNKWNEVNLKSLIINMPYDGVFYIWTKNEYGVISNPIKINVACVLSDSEEISASLIYCTGSRLKIANYSWHVISDINGELKLLMDSGQLDLMSHCESDISDEYCYYKSPIVYKSYKWSLSKINRYLNDELIKDLSDYKLKEYSVCNEDAGTSGCKDNDGCSGYIKEDVLSGGYSCKSYVKSKIRLLTYGEYNYIFKNSKDKKWLYNYKVGDFWLMNGYSESGYMAFKVNKQGLCYLDENVSYLLEVRPVITIYK